MTMNARIDDPTSGFFEAILIMRMLFVTLNLAEMIITQWKRKKNLVLALRVANQIQSD
ncbi:MAG: hypothetical protein AAF485_23770 [Chloroflexota bacterium]